jgi:predicted Zn-dependent peptidase
LGQNELSLESTTNQIMWMGESLIAYDYVIDPEEVQTKVKSVTPDTVQSVARLCFCPERMGIAVVGAVREDSIQRWLSENEM